MRLITIIICFCSVFSVFGQNQITRKQRNTQHQQTINTKKRNSSTNSPSQVKYTNQSVSGSLNGHDYVDLGLSRGRLWATYYIGSKTPVGYGDYFAWAETKSKASYTAANYRGCTDINTAGLCDIECDTIRTTDQITDNPQYDAARNNWGENWELPTSDDFA